MSGAGLRRDFVCRSAWFQHWMYYTLVGCMIPLDTWMVGWMGWAACVYTCNLLDVMGKNIGCIICKSGHERPSCFALIILSTIWCGSIRCNFSSRMEFLLKTGKVSNPVDLETKYGEMSQTWNFYLNVDWKVWGPFCLFPKGDRNLSPFFTLLSKNRRMLEGNRCG